MGCDRLLPWMGFLCSDKVNLSHNKVWPRQEFLGHNKVFSCRDRVWGNGQGSSCCDRELDVVIELSKFVSRQSMPYITIDSSRTWGFPGRDITLYVMTVGAKYCVVAMLCAHDRDVLS